MWWLPAVLVGAVVGLLLLLDLSVKRSKVWRCLQLFPGEPTIPLLGNALDIGFTPEAIQNNLERMWKKFGMQNFRVMMGLDPMLYICNPDDVKKLLTAPNQVKSDQQIHFFREAFGDSLVQTTGEKWKMMRRLLNPLFHPRLLEEHLKAVNTHGDQLLRTLSDHAGKPSFDIHPYLLNYAVGVVMTSLFGTDVNDSKCDQRYITASRKVLPNATKRFYSPWLRYDFLYNMSELSRVNKEVISDMNNALRKIINDRREYLDTQVIPNIENEEDVQKFISKSNKLLTFIDVILLSKMPDGKPFDEKYILDETNLMLFAGFDTNVSTIGFVIYNLATHPELQQKVYEEQVSIFGEDLYRKPTSKDLNNMKYLMRFIKESMRYYSTVGWFGRKITNDVKLDDGRVLAAGTNVIFYYNGLFRNPNYFKDPDSFDPDRFLESFSPYSYMPFGCGPRICIGMNYALMWVRSITSTLVRHYRFTHSGAPEDQVQLVSQVVNYSKNGIRVGLVQRK